MVAVGLSQFHWQLPLLEIPFQRYMSPLDLPVVVSFECALNWNSVSVRRVLVIHPAVMGREDDRSQSVQGAPFLLVWIGAF